MRIWAKCLVAASVVILPMRSEADTARPCDALEIIDIGTGYKDYNDLVCAGIEYMKEERFMDAITSFESALSIRFLDIPNFELFPRLALVSTAAGLCARAAAQ